MTNTPKKRIGYIDALRGFTMLLVVYTHIQLFCYGQFCHLNSPPWTSSNILIYIDLITLFFMPLFFFISGFVLYKQDVESSIRRSVRFVGRKALLLLLPTVVFISLYIAIFDAPMGLLCQSGRLGYWFTIALFEYYLFYAMYRLLCSVFHRPNGIDWVLLGGSAMLYFAVTQSVLNRLGVSMKRLVCSVWPNCVFSSISPLAH